MTTQTNFIEAVEQKNYSAALEFVNEGFPENMSHNTRCDFYMEIIRDKAFDLLNALIDKGKIIADVYELERFEKSIFDAWLQTLTNDAEILAGFKNFMQKAENINDEANSRTWLSYAIASGAEPFAIAVLIDNGIDLQYKTSDNDNLIFFTMHHCRRPDLMHQYIDLMLYMGIDANEKNARNQTPLHIAVSKHQEQLLPLLLKAGADPNEQDAEGNTVYHKLMDAAASKEIYEQLAAVQLPDFSIHNGLGQTILSTLLKNMEHGNPTIDMLQQLITDGANLNDTAPHYDQPMSGWDWVLRFHSAMLPTLIEQTGKDVNEQDDDGNTLLHKLCGVNLRFSEEAAKEIYKKAKYLLAAGADASITNTKEETAMMIAAADNLKSKTVELLLKA